jgi:hypothetical protein
MTIPNVRLEPVKDTLVMFAERPSGVPVAVKAWFYPGRSIGEEFMYPKQQATQIAKATHESVLTTQGDEKTSTGPRRVDDTGAVTPFKESAPSVGTSGRVAASSQQASADTRTPASDEQDEALRTASPIALFEVLSGLALAGGFGLRQCGNVRK